MGRRRTRKAERRLQQRGRTWWEEVTREPRDDAAGGRAERAQADPFADFGPGGSWDDGELLAAFSAGRDGAPARTCGGCREFVEDGELGRGTCLHPGSGVLHPWTDTAGCDFWSRGGRRQASI